MTRGKCWALCGVVAVLLLLILSGCGGGGGGEGAALSRSFADVVPLLKLSPNSATMVAGSTLVVNAAANNFDTTGMTWTATGGTITGSGTTITYTAPEAAGTYTVTVTSADGKFTDSASITVIAAPPTPSTQESIAIVPSVATISTGATLILSASLGGTTSGTVTWTASSGTISGTGATATYVAPATPDTVMITATTGGGSASASAAITVADPAVSETINLSPSVVTMVVGSTISFTAALGGTTNTAVIWTAAAGTIAGSGTTATYTAPSTVGMYLVTAKTADAQASATSIVTVTSPPPPPVLITVALSPPTATVSTGGMVTLTATVTNASNPAVAWSASAGSITGAGSTVTYTAPATAGTYTVSATSVQDGTASASATITVTAPPPPETISISPGVIRINTGASTTFTATLANAPDNSVIWTATAGTVLGSGTTVMYTAPAIEGTYTVRATTGDGKASNTATVTVTAPPPPPPVETVNVSPPTASVFTGGTVTLSATVENAADTSVSWIASGGSVPATGNVVTYTAPAVAGTYTVTATSGDGTASAFATITVTNPPPPETISISPATLSINTGASTTFTATIGGTSNTGVIWTATAGTVTGTSTTASYTAPATAGIYTVTATTVDGKASSTATVTVTAPPPPPPPPVTVTLSPPTASVYTGGSVGLTATVTNTANTAVVWQASGGSVSGSGNTVTYTAPATSGTYTVTATSVADGSSSSTSNITVTAPPPPETISVSPSTISITTGTSTNFTATLSNAPNNTVIWTATGGTIVGTSTSATYTAPNTAGTYTITATTGDGKASTTATVTAKAPPPPPPPITVTISPQTANIDNTQTLTLSATVDGTTSPSYVWSTTGGTITGSGAQVTYNPPLSAGTYTVVVAVGTASATATITVTAPPIIQRVTISLQTPASSTMPGGSSQSLTATVSGSSDTTVIWSVSPTPGGTFSGGTAATVTYTSPATAGTYTITAAAHADPSQTASTTITVPAPVVTITPTTATVNGGGTKSFTASVTNTNITGVTWTVSGGSIAPTGTTATFTAPLTPGTYTVRATSTADSNYSATATVTVPAPTITVSPTTANVGAGNSVSLTATVSNTTNKNVTWTSSGGSLSSTTGSTISFTAPNNSGTYTVTARSVADPSQQATATITSTLSITVAPHTATLNTGGSVAITATLVGAGSVTWTSTGGSISGTGLSVTYLAPGGAGSYTVTATSTLDGATSDSSTITVVIPPADSTAPSTPTNLTAAAISSSQINLSWSASTDNIGVAGYKIFRNGAQVGTAPLLSYSDTGLAAATPYSYTVSAYDAAGNESGQSSPANATTSATGWVAPIGIPTPSFGVNEVAPNPPSPWSSAVAGYYYVDTTGTYGTCSDSNTYGYPASGKARCTVPSTLGPGSYVEVHGLQNYDLGFNWNGNSSPWVANTSGPVWARGASYATRPTLRTWGTYNSSYAIIENVNFAARNTTDNNYGIVFAQGATVHHIALRNSEIAGGNTDNSISQNSSAIGMGEWGYHTGSNIVHDIVIDNVNIHDIGPTNPTQDIDQHCIAINGKVNNIWITHNTMAHCSGDSMQVEAQDGYKTNIHHIYFGMNHSTGNRQSGGWVKNGQDVIFSQNEADTFVANSGGPGACFGSQYDHDYVWYLFNTCHHSTIGVDLAADNGATSNVYMIGNAFWNIGSGFSFDPYNVCAFVLRQGTPLYLVNNSVYNYVAGICAPPGAGPITAVNNIFQYRNSSSGYEWYDEGTLTWTLSNNIFYPQTTLKSTTAWSSCSNCKNVDPLFVSTITPDLHLQLAPTQSPAVDAGIASGVYTTFQNRYGIDIRKDFDGNTRPLGAAWDIGAHEAK